MRANIYSVDRLNNKLIHTKTEFKANQNLVQKTRYNIKFNQQVGGTPSLSKNNGAFLNGEAVVPAYPEHIPPKSENTMLRKNSKTFLHNYEVDIDKSQEVPLRQFKYFEQRHKPING